MRALMAGVERAAVKAGAASAVCMGLVVVERTGAAIADAMAAVAMAAVARVEARGAAAARVAEARAVW